MEWVQPFEDYVHVPTLDTLNYASKNAIEGNYCMNIDQDTQGPSHSAVNNKL